MRLFSHTTEGIVIEDSASGVTGVIGLLPGRPLGSAPLVVAIERLMRDGARISVGLGPFVSESEAYDAFIDVFLDRFKRYPDGSLAQSKAEKVRVLGRVRSILVPRPLERELGFLVLSVAWRAVERNENAASAVNEFWKRLRPPAAGGDDKGGSLGAAKEESARKTFVQRKVLASDGKRQVEAVFGR